MNERLRSETALVLFSGGQDSATCLAWALSRFARVETLGFDYGQRHAIELACREQLLDGLKAISADWATRLGVSHTLKIPTLAEAMAEVLDVDEQRRFTDHLRPLVEAGRGTWRMAHAYLRAEKPTAPG